MKNDSFEEYENIYYLIVKKAFQKIAPIKCNP